MEHVVVESSDVGCVLGVDFAFVELSKRLGNNVNKLILVLVTLGISIFIKLNLTSESGVIVRHESRALLVDGIRG